MHWLVITDDDTILSVAKLAKLLNCYDPSNPIILGQRYGFKVNRGFQGYDYPTGTNTGLGISRHFETKSKSGKSITERIQIPNHKGKNQGFGKFLLQ